MPDGGDRERGPRSQLHRGGLDNPRGSSRASRCTGQGAAGVRCDVRWLRTGLSEIRIDEHQAVVAGHTVVSAATMSGRLAQQSREPMVLRDSEAAGCSERRAVGSYP